MMRASIAIDASFAVYALSNKLDRHLRLYIILNLSCSGKRKLSQNDLRVLSELLGYKSTKRVQSMIPELIKLGWIGFNPNSGYYHIRGIESIRKKSCLTGSIKVLIKIDHLRTFKSLLFSIVIAYLYSKSHYSSRPDIKSNQGLEKWESYVMAALTYIKKAINVPKSTIHRWKKDATKLGFIECMEHIGITIISAEYRHKLIEHYGYKQAQLFTLDGRIAIVLADMLKSKIEIVHSI